MKVAQWTGIAAGVWLMAAPAAVGYVDTTAGDLHRTVGPLAATVAVIALWPATSDVRWINVVAATALLAGPLFGGHPAAATVVAIATAAVLAATTPSGGRDRQRRGGGWRSVLGNQAGAS